MAAHRLFIRSQKPLGEAPEDTGNLPRYTPRWGSYQNPVGNETKMKNRLRVKLQPPQPLITQHTPVPRLQNTIDGCEYFLPVPLEGPVDGEVV